MVSGFSSVTLRNIDTTIFQVAPARINFKMVLSPKGSIDVLFRDQLRPVNLVKQLPVALKNYKEATRPTQTQKSSTLVSTEQTIDTLTGKDTLVEAPIANEFTESTSTPQEFGLEGTMVKAPKSDWIVGILLFSILLMAVIKFSYGKFLSKVIDSIFNHQVASNLFNEKNIKNLRGAIIMNLIFFINAAIFIVESLNYYSIAPIQGQGIHLFLLCFLGIVGLFLIKLVGFGIIGQVSKCTRESKEYIHNVFLYNKNLGVFLFPVIVGIPFIAPYAVPVLIKAGISIAAFFYMLRLFRGLKILFKKHVSIFYMILYLCALEILPLLMVYKLFVTLS
ncbi:MAG: DUF4271 domain-containing protein [Marinifilaceae bacterium]